VNHGLASLLVANRGEIAVRLLRAAAEAGIRAVAVYSEDDARSLHVRRADEARALRGSGPAAYLDVEQIVAVAREAGCDAIHPGYGFLAENAAFARRCATAGIVFVGPRPETLELFGDKARARGVAREQGVPVLEGVDAAVSVEQARAFLASLGDGGAMAIKAIAGGGGRGMRVVERVSEVAEAYARCRSEAAAAFGNGDLYVERLIRRARHVEVQIVGDGRGAVRHLGERDCTLQRRHQKLIECAPAPGLEAALRERLLDDAVRMARAARYSSLGTFEFLIDLDAQDASARDAYAFIEANARLQVEHTVTEEVIGVDLVLAQLAIAGGASLEQAGLDASVRAEPRGHAIQVRINMETVGADGTARPSRGTLTAFEPPSGAGLRTDTFGYVGYRTNPSFDSLLAKLIAHTPSPDFAVAARKTARALREFRIEGVPTNLRLLERLVEHPDFAAGRVHTRFVEERWAELAEAGDNGAPRLYFESVGGGAAATSYGAASAGAASERAFAGAKVDPNDPLAVLAHGKSGEAGGVSGGGAEGARFEADHFDAATIEAAAEAPGVVAAPMQGTIVSIDVAAGDAVRAGQQLFVMSAMKMEHVIQAPRGGVVRRIAVAAGDTVYEGHPVLFVEASEESGDAEAVAVEVDLDAVRPDLREIHDRHAMTLDAARPDAVERRRKTRQRTARENVDDLCDPGSLIEYGPLVIAAQRRRRTVEDLIARTPGDGMIAGVATVNCDLFGEERARCAVLSYDYTVLAGTQGKMNHEKKDRLFELAHRLRLPVVFFTEGGGGRPGDTDAAGVAGLTTMAFYLFGKLSGWVPIVGINSGRCFAGNAALLGSCDVIIATTNSSIGMGGPAMIEGGGLGVFRPEEVGPMSVQVPNGVVDIPVADEAEAVAVAKKYLSYFQGAIDGSECADQRLLRAAIPENRLRIYDVRRVIETLADTGSVLELRRHWGHGMVTALARIEGRPIGIVANNPSHLAGAITSEGADKASRFMQLCDAFDLPLLFLCDTPGIMVGPEIEKTALVRHCCRMFVVGASLTVPFFTIVLRKSYGLGAQAMAGGSFRAPVFTVAWPTGEFGGMGLEGSVKLGYRKELEAIEDPAARKALYDQMVANAYAHGKAVNTATYFEIDDVIDPAQSRLWVSRALAAAPPPPVRTEKKRPCVDTW
jgi:acetyl/propionyl-CoA carboxylase alpha subunit